MADIDTILERIRVGLARHGRKKQVADEIGVPAMLLTRATKPGWNPNADTIRKVDSAVRKLFPGDQPATPQQPE